MRDMPSSELVSLISFLAVLLLFFSIDGRGRIADEEDPWHAKVFEWTSRIGGVTTAFALALGWIDLFLADDLPLIHVGLVAVPGSVAVGCAIVLGLEMLFRDRSAGVAVVVADGSDTADEVIAPEPTTGS